MSYPYTWLDKLIVKLGDGGVNFIKRNCTLKKAIILVIALLLLVGLCSTCRADEFWDRVAKAGKMLSDIHTMTSKSFALDSEEEIKKHGREAYENIIFDDNKCPMCGKEK